MLLSKAIQKVCFQKPYKKKRPLKFMLLIGRKKAFANYAVRSSLKFMPLFKFLLMLQNLRIQRLYATRTSCCITPTRGRLNAYLSKPFARANEEHIQNKIILWWYCYRNESIISTINGSFECPIQDSSFLLENFTNVLETRIGRVGNKKVTFNVTASTSAWITETGWWGKYFLPLTRGVTTNA